MKNSQKSFSAMSDAEIIVHVQSGSNEAFDALMLRHQPHQLIYLHTLLHNTALEKDVSQEVWLDLLKRLRNGQYKEDNHFATWLSKATYHRAISAAKRERKMLHNEDALEQNSEEPHFEEELTRKAQLEAVQQALSHMNEKAREIVRERMLNEVSVNELATKYHTTPETIRSLLSKALKKLKDFLKGTSYRY